MLCVLNKGPAGDATAAAAATGRVAAAVCCAATWCCCQPSACRAPCSAAYVLSEVLLCA